MKRIFIKMTKGIGIVLLLLLITAGLFYGYVSHNIDTRAAKTYRFMQDTSRISKDSVLLAKGEHLIAIKGCDDCHAADLGGKVFLNETGFFPCPRGNASVSIYQFEHTLYQSG